MSDWLDGGLILVAPDFAERGGPLLSRQIIGLSPIAEIYCALKCCAKDPYLSAYHCVALLCLLHVSSFLMCYTEPLDSCSQANVYSALIGCQLQQNCHVPLFDADREGLE